MRWIGKGVPYVIVEPDNIIWNDSELPERTKERQLIKQQWFGRFVLRDNSHIKDFSKWLNHIKEIYDERTSLDFINKHHQLSFFTLNQNQYLSDIIDDLYWKKGNILTSTIKQVRFKKKDSHFSVNWNVTVFWFLVSSA